jgi:two-component system, sensor histidine kinase and response regulator
MSVFEQKSLPTLDKKTVFLVVDDFEVMRKVNVNQLRQLGAETIHTAKDGAEALRILHQHRVDVVLSDWNMPVMSGLELLQAMRADPKLRAIPLVMITAEAERDKVQEAIASGVTSLLLKPYSPSQLLTRVGKALTWKPRRHAADAAVSVPAPQAESAPTAEEALPADTAARPSILLVDDTPDNLMLLSQLLKSDYRIRLAQSGAKALEICTSDDAPDLVLLDVMMPGLDGFEVARRMREHPQAEAIPVIFVTAMTSTDARVSGMDLGAVDYITKPIDPGLLQSKVRNFMRYVQMHKNLQGDYDRMVELAQLREDVAQITRHDLKGPLAGALGLLQELTADDSMGRKQAEQLRLLEETTLQVLNMVNLSSELFKIETGRFQLNALPVAVVEILRRIVELNRMSFSSKQLTIAVDADQPVGAEVPQALGDAMLCYSLFHNLLKNACEAAPPNTRVTVRLHDETPLRTSLTNHGVVPTAIRERFFDKFVTSGKLGGSGLGTYSARLLAQAQHGDIHLLVDDEACTTTLEVTLPRVS